MIDSIVGIIRSRRVDLIAGAILLGVVVSLLLILAGGSPRWLLVRESFLTLAFGIVFLGSLVFPKPLGFYTSRQFLVGRDTKKIARFERLWRHASFRTIIRIQTSIWGVGLILEAVVRIFLVFTMSISQFLVVSPFILYGLIGLTIAASILSMRFWRARHGDKALQEEMKALQSSEVQSSVEGV